MFFWAVLRLPARVCLATVTGERVQFLGSPKTAPPVCLATNWENVLSEEVCLATGALGAALRGGLPCDRRTGSVFASWVSLARESGLELPAPPGCELHGWVNPAVGLAVLKLPSGARGGSSSTSGSGAWPRASVADIISRTGGPWCRLGKL